MPFKAQPGSGVLQALAPMDAILCTWQRGGVRCAASKKPKEAQKKPLFGGVPPVEGGVHEAARGGEGRSAGRAVTEQHFSHSHHDLCCVGASRTAAKP